MDVASPAQVTTDSGNPGGQTQGASGQTGAMLSTPVKRTSLSVSESSSPSKDASGGSASAKKVKLSSIENLSESTEYSLELVQKYLSEMKSRQVETLLDDHLEKFYLENSGLIIEFPAYRKKPIKTNLIQQYFDIEVCDPELSELLASRMPPEPFYGSSSAKVTTHHHHAVPSSHDVTASSTHGSSSAATHHHKDLPPLTPLIISSRTSSSSTTHGIPSTPMNSHHHPEGTTPHVSPARVPHVPRVRTSSISSAKTTFGSLIHGAAAYGSRAHATRQQSISVVYENTIGSQEQIVERAKQEAQVMQRIAELRKNGLWSLKRLPKVQEPPRTKAHWDYLLEEMSWLSADFAQERKWKKAAAKKCARMVMRYHLDKEAQKEKERREELSRLRKIASTIAKDIRNFWSNVEKLVDYKQQTRLEKKRKQALDMHLNFIVGQTEQYTEWLTEGLKTNNNSKTAAETGQTDTIATSHAGLIQDVTPEDEADDGDFQPADDDLMDVEDDEDTIAKEEQEVKTKDVQKEIELLQQESEATYEDVLASLPPGYLENRENITFDQDEESQGDDEEKSADPDLDESEGVDADDTEFKVDAEEEDDEGTIAAQEAQEEKNYQEEIKELEADANLTREELIAKYTSGSQDSEPLPLDSPHITEDDEEVDDMSQTEGDDDETEEDVMNESVAGDDDVSGNEDEEVDLNYLYPEKTLNESQESPDVSFFTFLNIYYIPREMII